MPDDFFSIDNTVPVEAKSFRLKRAIDLFVAVRRTRDFDLVDLLQRSVDDTSVIECLIVDVACDGVPSRNSVGIAYPERIALIVPADEKEQVEVWVLRKDFPILLHQNQVIEGMPASLCLYMASKTAILRSWTAERFLHRIQWWLEMAATGRLHSEDQPLEQLFLECPFELVLPWNFTELSADPNKRFFAAQSKKRPDGGRSFFVDELVSGDQSAYRVALIELKLQPVVHGLEREPANLGQLVASLDKRGADLTGALKQAIQARVSEDGVDVDSDETTAIIMLQVPTCRQADGPVERTRTRAFMLGVGALMKIGASMGALFLSPGNGRRYYCDRSGQLGQPTDAWKSESIFPMEVLRRNSAEDFRQQSGITDVGGPMTLIGVGALGGAMLNLWGRSGWGQWTVIDKDHIKPHNLTRHEGDAGHIGKPKVEAMAELHEWVVGYPGSMATVVADACDFSHTAVQVAVNSASLVIDASTTLEYPRLASSQEGVGRHVSVFISPDGNSSVLMMESEDRAIRLRTLEAVYYRAIINEDWGKDHLAGNLGTFFSGASCRDISLILPYSRVTAHASTLAEQIPQAKLKSTPMTRVWKRDPDTGEVAMYEIPAYSEQRIDFDDMALFIDEGLKDKLKALRAKVAPDETGGVLVGYYDFQVKMVVVVDCLEAPPDSKSSSSSFERGTKGLAERISDISLRTAGIVGYIGEWHSHPPGHNASPSQDDLVQLWYLALGMGDEGLPALSLIVGENDISILQGKAG